MNQTSQYIFNLFHYLLNVRDTLEYVLDREHSKVLYDQRKEVITNGYKGNTALGNFFANNKEQGEKITEKIEEFINEVYGDDSNILTVTGDTVRVDHTQNLKILDYVVGITESVRDIIYGYINFARGKNELEEDIATLVAVDDRFYRVLFTMLTLREFEKSFAEFQKVMNESKGKPSPQSNFIVQNELMKLAMMLRFVRQHHHCTDNETLDLLDEVNALIEMTEGRRDRRDNKAFKDLFADTIKKLNALVAKVEPQFKENYQKNLQAMLELTRKQAKVEA